MYGIKPEYKGEISGSQPSMQSTKGCDSSCWTLSTSVLIYFSDVRQGVIYFDFFCIAVCAWPSIHVILASQLLQQKCANELQHVKIDLHIAMRIQINYSLCADCAPHAHKCIHDRPCNSVQIWDENLWFQIARTKVQSAPAIMSPLEVGLFITIADISLQAVHVHYEGTRVMHAVHVCHMHARDTRKNTESARALAALPAVCVVYFLLLFGLLLWIDTNTHHPRCSWLDLTRRSRLAGDHFSWLSLYIKTNKIYILIICFAFWQTIIIADISLHPISL